MAADHVVATSYIVFSLLYRNVPGGIKPKQPSRFKGQARFSGKCSLSPPPAGTGPHQEKSRAAARGLAQASRTRGPPASARTGARRLEPVGTRGGPRPPRPFPGAQVAQCLPGCHRRAPSGLRASGCLCPQPALPVEEPLQTRWHRVPTAEAPRVCKHRAGCSREEPAASCPALETVPSELSLFRENYLETYSQ